MLFWLLILAIVKVSFDTETPLIALSANTKHYTPAHTRDEMNDWPVRKPVFMVKHCLSLHIHVSALSALFVNSRHAKFGQKHKKNQMWIFSSISYKMYLVLERCMRYSFFLAVVAVIIVTDYLWHPISQKPGALTQT